MRQTVPVKVRIDTERFSCVLGVAVHHTCVPRSAEINRMAQTQLVEAAQAMRKMKQHVEQLARTKRHYESTIKDMSEKLTSAEKANLELRSRKPEPTPDDLATADELAASRREVRALQDPACFHYSWSNFSVHWCLRVACAFYGCVRSLYDQIEDLKQKLTKTEDNCQRVLARIGVADNGPHAGVGTTNSGGTTAAIVGVPTLLVIRLHKINLCVAAG